MALEERAGLCANGAPPPISLIWALELTPVDVKAQPMKSQRVGGLGVQGETGRVVYSSAIDFVIVKDH